MRPISFGWINGQTRRRSRQPERRATGRAPAPARPRPFGSVQLPAPHRRGLSRASADVSGTMRQRNQCQGRRRLRRRCGQPARRQRCNARRLTEAPRFARFRHLPKTARARLFGLATTHAPGWRRQRNFWSPQLSWQVARPPARGRPSVQAVPSRGGRRQALGSCRKSAWLARGNLHSSAHQVDACQSGTAIRGRLSYGKPAFIVAALRSRRQKTVPAARARKQ